MATMWRSNAAMYVTVPYNKVLFSILYFFNQPIRGWFWNCPHKWFHTNLLMLNYDKTHFLLFLTKTDHENIMRVSFGNRKIATTESLKFLGLTIDTFLTWKHHIGELTSRLNKACYAIRSIMPFMSLELLRSTYFSYVHSIIASGIIFWGNSSYSEDIFKILKV